MGKPSLEELEAKKQRAEEALAKIKEQQADAKKAYTAKLRKRRTHQLVQLGAALEKAGVRWWQFDIEKFEQWVEFNQQPIKESAAVDTTLTLEEWGKNEDAKRKAKRAKSKQEKGDVAAPATQTVAMPHEEGGYKWGCPKCGVGWVNTNLKKGAVFKSTCDKCNHHYTVSCTG